MTSALNWPTCLDLCFIRGTWFFFFDTQDLMASVQAATQYREYKESKEIEEIEEEELEGKPNEVIVYI